MSHGSADNRLRMARGYTLLEITFVLGIMGVIMAMSAGALSGLMKESRADSAVASALNTLRVARDRAIGERRNFEVRFIDPNHIQIARVELPDGNTTVVTDTYVEGYLEFLLVDDAGDTPDEFGHATAIAFGSSLTRMFTSEGTFVDSSGDPLNGTIFLAAKGNAMSARAITILGATALIHAWRWNGRAWVD